MSRKVNASYTAAQVRHAFEVFAGNAPPGHIRVDALVAALCTYGSEKLKPAESEELISQVSMLG